MNYYLFCAQKQIVQFSNILQYSYKSYMQPSNSPTSILSLYFSKQNIGIASFNKNQLLLKCTLIQYYIATTRHQLKNLIDQIKPQLIITNNNKHAFLYDFDNSIKINKIDQRGLQDDIIENNISLLKFNPVKQPIQNKIQYIKLMKEHSQSCGLMNQKYRVLGIMLYYLFNSDDFSITTKLYINDIVYFFDEIFQYLQVSNSQLQAFQIIKEEVHPSLIKGKGRSKQGFSVLSLYQTPLSSAGSKKILRNIFRNPTYDKRILQKRLNLITWIKKNCNDYKNLMNVFRSVHSVDTIMHKFNDSRVQNQDWRKFVRTLQSMIIIHKILQEKVRASQYNQVPQFFQDLFNEINWVQIARLLSSISSTLDLEQGTIKRGVDPQLDELKKTYDNLPHLLTLYARQQNWNQDFRIVFMTQIGYLIRTPHQVQIPEIRNENWTLQFVKNSGKFYCNELTTMLDNQYGDIYGEITDRQKKINFQLQNIVSEHSEAIQKAYWKICQLQCFVGVTIVSNGMCRPKLSSQSLIISRGWHLLIAQDPIQNHAFSFNQHIAPKNRVYNSEQNLVNTNYSNRMMLITGPNGSGKTIYLKQNSIIIYLAHLGFYVPAEFSQIPLVDKIILIQSKKSIYTGHNGFQSEISSLSRITTPGLLTNKSLILIDQLASSIDRILAKKILTTVIQFIQSPKQSCIIKNTLLHKPNDEFEIPLVISITHLTDIMTQSIIQQNYQLRYLTMDMQKNQTYLYKVKPGIVKKGYGIQCAKMFMNQRFIKRAEKIWENLKYRC